MAFLKGKYVQSSSLDGSKIKLKNGEALKGTKADGSEKEIVKVNGQDKVEFPETPVVSQDPQSDNELARKAYVDAQREAAKAHSDAKDALQDAALAAEAVAREAGDSALDARLDAIEADPVTKAYVDAGDQDAKDYADQKIAALVNSAPETLDTLKELADAIAAGETASQGLLTLIGQTDDKIDTEVLNRQSADQVLDDKVDQEIADRQAGDSALDVRLDAALAGIDAALGTKASQTDLNAEIADRQAGDTAEAAARQAADAAEATARQDGDATERTAREAADAALGARLQTLESDPVSKTYVDGQMAGEVSARQAADGVLSGRLSLLEADPTTKSYVDSEVAGSKSYTDGKIGDLINGAPAMLDTLKEIADAIGAGSDVATGLANSISQEVSDRQAADLVLDGKIASERSRALVEESRIEGKVDAETSAREQAIIAEATARDAAISVAVMAEQFARELFDASFDQRLNQEVLDREAAINAEQATRDAAVTGLSSIIGHGLTLAASDLAQETSAREAGDAAIDARINALEVAPSLRNQKQTFTMTAQNIANGYVDCAHLAAPMSMVLYVGGLVHFEEEDYTLSEVAGKTRITFMGDLVLPSSGALLEGDKVRVQYMTTEAAGDGGGGGGGPVITSINLVETTPTTVDVQMNYTGSPESINLYKFVNGTGFILEGSIYLPTGGTWTYGVLKPQPSESGLIKVEAVVENIVVSELFEYLPFVQPEIVVSGAPEINTTDMSDPQIASGKAKVTWSFSGTAVAIEGKNWDEAAGQYSESISTTNLPSPAEGTLVRYASRTAFPQKLLRRLVGQNGGRSEWFELIIQGTGGSVE